MSEYLLKKGSIETNSDGEVVGATSSYFHLIGEDISDVVRRREARGIRKAAHPDPGLPHLQKVQKGFRTYGKSLLQQRQSTSR
jgi:hypothetical protein